MSDSGRLTGARGRSGASRPSRPFGIYVIALLQALNALAAGARAFGYLDDVDLGVLSVASSETLSVLAMGAGLAIAAGLLLLQRWAWVATMLWVGATVASELVIYFDGEEANYPALALSVAQVFYLNLSDVQNAFARRRQEQESTRG